MTIVLCPNCNTKYKIDENILSLEGKRVRCTVCDYLWIETRPITNKDIEIVKITDAEAGNRIFLNNHIITNDQYSKNKLNNDNIDTYTSNHDSSLWLYLINVFNIACICLIFYNFSYAIPNFIEPVYRLMKIYDTKMIIMEKPNIIKCGNKCYKININFKNIDKFIQNMPRVKLSFMNDKTKLQSIYLNKNDQIKLKAQEEYKFSKIVLNIPENTNHIVIEKGNIIELI